MPSKNIPVNGWPQLKDLEAVQPTLDRLDKIEAWKRTVKEETFTGDDIIINNALALPARSLITEINAIQDLHGLPFPYVGGAYKNKLPLTTDNIKSANGGASSWTGNKKTISGSEVEILEDADGNTVGIKISNTPNATLIVNLYTFASGALSGNYALNGCPTNGGDSTYNITLFDGTTALRDNGSGVSFASSDFSSAIQCFIRIQSGYAIPSGGLIFKPMIRLSTELDATFAPYSNICPISGRTAVEVDDLPNADYAPFFEGVKNGTYGFVDLGTLNWKYNSTNSFFWLDPNVLPNKQLGNLSCAIYNYVGAKTDAQMATVDNMSIALSSGNNIKVKNTSYTDATTFTTAMSGVYLIYELATPTTPSYTAEQWAALVNSFGGNNVTIQLGQTVYGADINWDTGVGTVLWAIQVFTGADNENWDLSGNSKRVNSPLISDAIEKPADNNTVGHIISDKFKALTANETYTGSQGAGISIDAGNGIINVNDGTGSMTVSAWKTYLASNNLQVCYKLATPTTLQLTPEQLTMLKGYNRVTLSDGYGTIELKALTGANWS